MSDPYQANHVTFDEHEIPLTLHCLCCHAVIARRSDTPGRTPGINVHSIVKGPNYREVYAELSDGSVCYFPFCQDCIRQPINHDAALDVVKRGWELALAHAGRPSEAIEHQRKRVAHLAVIKPEPPPIVVPVEQENNDIQKPIVEEKAKARSKPNRSLVRGKKRRAK